MTEKNEAGEVIDRSKYVHVEPEDAKNCNAKHPMQGVPCTLKKGHERKKPGDDGYNSKHQAQWPSSGTQPVVFNWPAV